MGELFPIHLELIYHLSGPDLHTACECKHVIKLCWECQGHLFSISKLIDLICAVLIHFTEHYFDLFPIKTRRLERFLPTWSVPQYSQQNIGILLALVKFSILRGFV